MASGEYDGRKANAIKAKIKKNFERNALALHKKGSIGMLEKFAIATPTETGNATGAWVLGVNVKSASPTSYVNLAGRPVGSHLDRDFYAKDTIKRAQKNVNKAKYKDEIIISNSASTIDSKSKRVYYIKKLENGGSKQAPTGMFYKTLPVASLVFNRAKRDIGL